MGTRCAHAFTGTVAALVSQTLFAAEATPAFAFGDLFKLVFALVLTIALFVLMAFVMKKLQLGTGGGNRLITVLAALPLGGKEKLYLLEVGGEQLLVGSSPGHVSCVHVLSKPVGTADKQQELAPTLNFGDVLRVLKQGKGE